MDNLTNEQLAKADQQVRDQQALTVCREVVKLMRLHNIDPDRVSLLQPGPGLTIVHDPVYVKLYAASQQSGQLSAKKTGINGSKLLQ